MMTGEVAPAAGAWQAALADMVRHQEINTERAAADARTAYGNARLLLLAIGGDIDAGGRPDRLAGHALDHGPDAGSGAHRPDRRRGRLEQPDQNRPAPMKRGS
ncbi:hypothetical protein LP419_23665 [Massilia sp. H-1]|nr:hypothetical protein LP419_23665 [Massilia sp. H-1]